MDPARAEANVRRAIAARRAAIPLPGVVGHPAAVAEPLVAAAEDPPEAAVAVGGEKRDRKE